MTDKMRDEFESWAVLDAASTDKTLKFEREGEWYMGKDHQVMNLGWAAWQASREALVIELPEPEAPESYGVTRADDSEQYEALESRMGAQYSAIHKCRRAIESAGVKVKP